MTSGVLVCIKNKTAAFLKKKKQPTLYVHGDIQPIWSWFRNHVQGEFRRHMLGHSKGWGIRGVGSTPLKEGAGSWRDHSEKGRQVAVPAGAKGEFTAVCQACAETKT